MLKHSLIAIGAGYLFLAVTRFIFGYMNQNLVTVFMFVAAGITGYLAINRSWLHGMILLLLDLIIEVSGPIFGFLSAITSAYLEGLPVVNKSEDSFLAFLFVIFITVIFPIIVIGIAGGMVGGFLRTKTLKRQK